MNSYVRMTMVKKEQKQDNYFSQQAYLLHLPAYTSATDAMLHVLINKLTILIQQKEVQPVDKLAVLYML